jgi:lysophospholipase L1-like esterase
VDKRRSKSLDGPGRRRWVIGASIAVVAIGATVLSVAALQQPRTDPQAAASYTPAPFQTRTPPPIPVRTQLADVLPRLRDTARPFNVVVFSDSTGAGRETWTALTGEWLGDKYGRTVEGVQWDIHEEPNGYRGSKWHLSEGEGAVVNWWNGASAGRDAVYSLENIDEIAPIPGESVDLVFVNHGHNHSKGELVPEVKALVTEATARYPNAAVALVAQNPESSDSPHQPTQQREVQALGQFAKFQGYPIIDVYTPFSEQDVDALIDDTLYHPTPDGYQFWADQVTQALDAADPDK